MVIVSSRLKTSTVLVARLTYALKKMSILSRIRCCKTEDELKVMISIYRSGRPYDIQMTNRGSQTNSVAWFDVVSTHLHITISHGIDVCYAVNRVSRRLRRRYYERRIQDLRSRNTANWWRKTKRLTGQSKKQSDSASLINNTAVGDVHEMA